MDKKKYTFWGIIIFLHLFVVFNVFRILTFENNVAWGGLEIVENLFYSIWGGIVIVIFWVVFGIIYFIKSRLEK